MTKTITSHFRIAFIIIALLLVLGIVWAVSQRQGSPLPHSDNTPPPSIEYSWETEVIADNLDIPWDFAFLPDNTLLVTERAGRVVRVGNGERHTVADVRHTSEGGLLGIALHPNFSTNYWVYLYQTTDVNGPLENRVLRYIYHDGDFSFDQIIIDGIPGAQNHDGGRIEFGPDGFLYITTGDAGNASSAQDTNSLAGAILRITDEGSIPSINPFDNAIYSYGHRNPQGLAWDAGNRLWSTEHGRSGLLSGYDEINLITKGSNYGWPDSEGDTVAEGTVAPILHSGATTTWAPASLAYRDAGMHYGASLFFGGLRGQALYEAILDGEEVVEVIAHFEGEFGRIRTVRIGPDGYLYMTTSNRDGRGNASGNDDKIIRIK